MRGFSRLLLTQATRDRWVLPIWIVGIAMLGLAASAAVVSEFAEEADRGALIAVAVANPALLFLRGIPDGLSVGALVFFQAFAFTAVLAGLMSTFLVVRHTRSDEELGRGELVGATPVGRATPLAATLTLGVLANMVLTVGVALGYIAGGLPVDGSIRAALAVGSVGLVFVGVAAVVAQLMPHGRGANGVASALVGIAYLLRGIGDALGTPSEDLLTVTPAAVSWTSPIGWGQATRPFGDEPSLAPLLIGLGIAVAMGALALALRARRDLGASLVADRSGRERARLGGRSVLGLAWRLQRGTLLGWIIGGIVLGGIAGGIGPVVADALSGNESLTQLIARLVPGSEADVVDMFISGMLGIAGILSAAAGVQAVQRLRAEEAEGRAELLLSTPTDRAQWMGSTLAVAALSVLAVCVATGAAAGAAIARTQGDTDAIGRYTGAALAHAPAAAVFVAVTALVFAFVPRLTVALGWGLLTIGLVLGQFGELLQLPEWLQQVSPFFWSSAVPVEELDVAAAATLVAIALGGSVAALLALRRRDLTA